MQSSYLTDNSGRLADQCEILCNFYCVQPTDHVSVSNEPLCWIDDVSRLDARTVGNVIAMTTVIRRRGTGAGARAGSFSDTTLALTSREGRLPGALTRLIGVPITGSGGGQMSRTRCRPKTCGVTIRHPDRAACRSGRVSDLEFGCRKSRIARVSFALIAAAALTISWGATGWAQSASNVPKTSAPAKTTTSTTAKATSTAAPQTRTSLAESRAAAAERARRASASRARAAELERQRIEREAMTPHYKRDLLGNQVPDVRAAAAIIFDPQTNAVLWEQNAHDSPIRRQPHEVDDGADVRRRRAGPEPGRGGDVCRHAERVHDAPPRGRSDQLRGPAASDAHRVRQRGGACAGAHLRRRHGRVRDAHE